MKKPFILKLNKFENTMDIESSNVLFHNNPNKKELKYGKLLEINKNFFNKIFKFGEYDMMNIEENRSGYNHLVEIKKIFGLSETIPVFKYINNINENKYEIEDDISILSICNNWNNIIKNSTNNEDYIIQLWSTRTNVICQIIAYISTFYQDVYLYRPILVNPFSELKYLVLLGKKNNQLINLPTIDNLFLFQLFKIDQSTQTKELFANVSENIKYMNKRLTLELSEAYSKMTENEKTLKTDIELSSIMQNNQNQWKSWVEKINNNDLNDILLECKKTFMDEKKYIENLAI